MGPRPVPRVALMAIQPRFAQAILSGEKRVEFRKRRLATDIDTVLIYESAPSQRIVGSFTIARTDVASPSALWREFAAVGGIPRREFMDYYTGHAQGVGLVVGAVDRYQRPVALRELAASPAVPQSFTYLPASTLEEIADLQPAAAILTLPGLVGRLLQTSGRVLAGVGSD